MLNGISASPVIHRGSLFMLVLCMLSGCAPLSPQPPKPVAQALHPLDLTRGARCEGPENYPTNVNLRFDKILILDALQLLAGFSCNDIKTNFREDYYINTNYTEVPWTQVVQEICSANRLTCWTEAEVLYVSINSEK